MADGRLNKCKLCTKRYIRDRYANPTFREKIREYDRSRAQTPDRKAKSLSYQQAMRLRNPGKYRARSAVNNAIRDGRLIRRPCKECGELKTQAHHTDYRKPLTVVWLCFRHHRERHGQTVNGNIR